MGPLVVARKGLYNELSKWEGVKITWEYSCTKSICNCNLKKAAALPL
jgi:hypothetical protein